MQANLTASTRAARGRPRRPSCGQGLAAVGFQSASACFDVSFYLVKLLPECNLSVVFLLARMACAKTSPQLGKVRS